MEFHETKTGKKFFASDFPQLMGVMKRIAEGLEGLKPVEIEPIKIYGKFEEITPEEQAKIDADRSDFDKWYEKMYESFELANADSIDMVALKNLVRHAWLANK